MITKLLETNGKYPLRSSVAMHISEDYYQKFSEQLYSSNFSDNIFKEHLRSDLPPLPPSGDTTQIERT